MGRVETIQDLIKTNDYDAKVTVASTIDSILDGQNRLRERPQVEIPWESPRTYLGWGADSIVCRGSADFDSFNDETLAEILTDFKTHEMLRTGSEYTIGDYPSLRKKAEAEVESLSWEDARKESLRRIRNSFSKNQGSYRCVVYISKKNVEKKSGKPRRYLHTEWLLGLQHEHLIGIVHAFISDHHVIQLAEWGGDRRWETLSLEDKVRVTSHVCEGLSYLHHLGVLHRDIKPDNVLITGTKNLQGKLCDFSRIDLKPLKDKGFVTKTEIGVGVGTRGFIAPEQAKGRATPLSDVYGVGALLYCYMTEQPPADQVEGLAKSQDPLLAKQYDDTKLAQNLKYIIAGCLQQTPSNRYRSVSEVKQDLDDVLNGKRPANYHALLDHLIKNRQIINRNEYVDNVFSEKSHFEENQLTAELVASKTAKPSEQPAESGIDVSPVQPEPVSRKKLSCLRVLVYSALTAGLITGGVIYSNPGGFGSIIAEKAVELYDSCQSKIREQFKKF